MFVNISSRHSIVPILHNGVPAVDWYQSSTSEDWWLELALELEAEDDLMWARLMSDTLRFIGGI